VRRLVDAGHVIGNHSFRHDPSVSARALMEEVRQTRELLADLTGKATNLFRPPGGKLTIAKLAGLWRSSQTVVHWNRNPRDWACSSSGMLEDWFRALPPQTGDLVLLHDNQPYAGIVLPSLIEAVRGRGLEFATVAEWTGLPMPEACGKRGIGGDLPG
jgi:peptidoglycan/xylan/chitin deacetylase (PgdA/CDA1 family)